MPAEGKSSLSVALEPLQLQWLREQAKAHSLPDEGKAVRCCVNFAAQAEGSGPPGSLALSSGATSGCEELVVAVAAGQEAWLRTGPGDVPSAVRAVVAECMRRSPAEVFGVVRCKTNTTEAGGPARPADAQPLCAAGASAHAALAEDEQAHATGCACSK
ncbi:unnamed protein product [Polarella glacialis]|uniref:Uncharacterized protein n=1 Tax=Polarella glacialis TaxID=89957 RepID=A0A813H3G2_POLGL|nr:unnamed protein product [Polarella glacialis]